MKKLPFSKHFYLKNNMGDRQPFRFRMPWFTTVGPPRSTEPSAPPPRRPPFRPAGIAPATQTQPTQSLPAPTERTPPVRQQPSSTSKTQATPAGIASATQTQATPSMPPQQPTEPKTPLHPPTSSPAETQNTLALDAAPRPRTAPRSPVKIEAPPSAAAPVESGRLKPAPLSGLDTSTPPVVVQPASLPKKLQPTAANEPLQAASHSNTTRSTDRLPQESRLKSEKIPESSKNKLEAAKLDEERINKENKELVLVKNQKDKKEELKIQEEKKDVDRQLAVQENKKDQENENAGRGITRLFTAGLESAKGAREALETKIQEALKTQTQETLKKKDQNKGSGVQDNQKDQENKEAKRRIQHPLAAGLDSTKEGKEVLETKIQDLETKKQETTKKDREKEREVQENKKDRETEDAKRRIPTPLAAGSDATKGTREELNNKIQSEEVSRGNSDQFRSFQPTYRPKPGSNAINSHQKFHGPEGEKPSLSKEIKEDVNKMTWHLASGQPNKSYGEKPASVVTVAGDNKGATMNIGLDSSKKDGSVHIRRGYKSNPDESPHSTTEPEGSSSKGKNLKESNQETPIRAYVNNNVQSVNNSITFDSSVNQRNPGVHMVFRVGKSEPMKVGAEPEKVETRKAETRVMPAEKVTYEPRVRRRCLRGLFLEPSDSDPDNPDKPRRHGCRYTCGEKGKDKDIGIF